MEEDGGGDTSPVRDGQREQPVSPSPSDPLPSEGADTTTAILDRTIELARLILGELNRRGLDPDLLRLSDGRLDAVVPASSEAMARLRETTVAETREDDECAVCWESYEEGDKICSMPCSHAFHDGCIRRWLAISRHCPLCRFALQPQAGAQD